MSLIQHKEISGPDGSKQVEATLMQLPMNKKGEVEAERADYTEDEATTKVSALILKHFIQGYTNLYTPRVEFNDLSLITRDTFDQMAFNTYQPNNGEAWAGAPTVAWRSRAIRPVVRNKCMSIAAHATARLIFPKIFAYDQQNEEQTDAADVMEDLMEWSGDVSDYAYVALMRVITAMSSPASIGFTEYGEVTRTVKRPNEDGTFTLERVRDQAYPLFMDEVVPTSQFLIQNFFEPDIQRQGWVIWRKVYSYSEAQNKYGSVYDNFKYVRPGVQTLYSDANAQFYYVYDYNMRNDDVEEIIYWNKNLDLKIIMVNRVMLTNCENPNPRKDKLYPFDKFGYEPINNRFFYYKSLAFKLQHDADIVNTLYQMVIDGTYLSIFKPMVNVGGEIIASDVIVPGAVTTLSDPNADLRAINVGSDLKSGLETLGVVENSINESSQEPLPGGNNQPGGTTAYEISRLEANANTVLGLFLQMIAKHVKDYGKLRLGDILQYLTMPDVVEITGEPEMTYKTFFIPAADKGGKSKKIQLDHTLPDEMEPEDHLDMSWDLMAQEKEKGMAISKVNPGLFRELSYMVTISPDVMNPRSTDLERAYNLEEYDRMVLAPPGMFDPQETAKLLLISNPSTKNEPDKYVAKSAPQGAPPPGGPMGPANGQPGAPSMPKMPGGRSPAPATPPAPALASLGQ